MVGCVFSDSGITLWTFFVEEARKLALSNIEEKRAFFPENENNSNSLFHACLLSRFWSHGARSINSSAS
jgi:hypothetical protein